MYSFILFIVWQTQMPIIDKGEGANINFINPLLSKLEVKGNVNIHTDSIRKNFYDAKI